MVSKPGTCANCEDRKIWTNEDGTVHTCHQTCEKYLADQEERNRVNEKIRAQQKHDNWLEQCGKERSAKYRKKMRIKKR